MFLLSLQRGEYVRTEGAAREGRPPLFGFRVFPLRLPHRVPRCAATSPR
jgi:hypothetical protein